MTNPPGFEPHFSYSFKSFVPGWQASSSGAAGASAGASAAGAASAAAGAGGGGGFPPPNAHYHNYYGGRYYRPRRFGFGRRFVWFGLGAMAATWWISHKTHHDERRKLWHQEMRDRHPNAAFPEAQPPYKFDWTSHRPAFPCSERARAPPAEPATPAVAIPTEFPKPAPVVAAVPVPEPAIVAAPVVAAAPAAQAPVADDKPRRSWGWRARRREQAEREKAERDAATAAAAATPAVVPEDEMARIRESVERLWEERVREGREAQARAEDAAREYARDKLDRLSSTLDRLRETLDQPKTGSDGKPRDGRMV
ncbi:uncharacterized protein LOC62_02G002188 [Vanrija pseudolonga]|uniref:Uncharacterized protein n=1 Tax=Vanrija pseudolonga TaxID=143232 RepID=A0AAF0Y1T3_9TREE|nr:hypothetical protein LOC62_02G002188 [Vanrija pseudolonga]